MAVDDSRLRCRRFFMSDYGVIMSSAETVKVLWLSNAARFLSRISSDSVSPFSLQK